MKLDELSQNVAETVGMPQETTHLLLQAFELALVHAIMTRDKVEFENLGVLSGVGGDITFEPSQFLRMATKMTEGTDE